MLGLGKLSRKLFGRADQEVLDLVRQLVLKINSYEAEFSDLPDGGLRERTQHFKARALSGETLDQLLPEAFANCREALRRVLGLRAFDVQLMGSILLHQGKIAEMATGEGKTLVAVFAAYLNSLPGKGVHVATINEYLAKRDAEWMGKTYDALGVTCGLICPGQLPVQRRLAYLADITYSTYSELGFDFLKDSRRSAAEDLVQRGHSYAIIDEADSVLIDEARTPLIISGPSQDRTDLYLKINEIVSRCQLLHFDLNRVNSSVMLTEDGMDFFERELRGAKLLPEGQSLYDADSHALLIHTMQALRAHKIFARDQHYIIRGQNIVLINSSSGRMMEQRRLTEGLHQAIEAKEGLPINPEAITLASTTVQNYFRLYSKLSGMSGTAVTDAEELLSVYNLEVVPLPTNKPILRHDNPDQIFRTEIEKDHAIMNVIRDAHQRKQPMLIGTASIEKSEYFSKLLENEGIEHKVLNAHQHALESQIIANAGRLGAVTIATNMAGRGTDIQLGGDMEIKLQHGISSHPEVPESELLARISSEHERERTAVLAAGGLLVLGTARHESRRIDNQLRGRSGRQGDPGQTQFFLSLEDELVQKVETDWLADTRRRLKIQDGQEVDHSGFVELMNRVQKRVEARNFQARKQLLRYDDVINDQRKIIFAQRLELMSNDDLSESINSMRHQFIDDLISSHLPTNSYAEPWSINALEEDCRDLLSLDLPLRAWIKEEGIEIVELRSRVHAATDSKMQAKIDILGVESMRNLEKQILLRAIDSKWREHCMITEQLRSTIGLRSFGKRDPLSEFKIEALDQFEKFLAAIRQDVATNLARVRTMTEGEQLLMMSKFAASV